MHHHHLESLAAEVHRTYFFKYPPLIVRWGQQIARKRRNLSYVDAIGYYVARKRRLQFLTRDPGFRGLPGVLVP